MAPVAIRTCRPVRMVWPTATAVGPTKRAAVEALGARTGKVVLEELRRLRRFRAFKAHQLLPVNGHAVGAHPLAGHTRRRVDNFGRAHEHLFGMAPTQRTGAAERAGIDDGHSPPRGPTPEGRGGSGGARPKNDQIILSLLLSHALAASLYPTVMAASRWKHSTCAACGPSSVGPHGPHPCAVRPSSLSSAVRRDHPWAVRPVSLAWEAVRARPPPTPLPGRRRHPARRRPR